MPEQNPNNDKVNDLNTKYGKEIHFFNSIAEQEAFNVEKTANQHPVERVRETVQLIIRIYSKSLSEKSGNSDSIIVIDKE